MTTAHANLPCSLTIWTPSPAGPSLSAVHRIALAAFILLSACSGAISPDGRLKGEAEEAVKRLLRDPESARFDYGPLPSVFPELAWVCGEVNSRNGFGGYAGKQMFAYARDDGAYLIEGDMEGFSRVNRRCIAAIEARTREITDRTNAMFENDPGLRNKVEAQSRNAAAN